LDEPETAGKQMAQQAVLNTGGLTGSPDKDLKIVQWLVDHYKQL
jgi:hypothetical protein